VRGHTKMGVGGLVNGRGGVGGCGPRVFAVERRILDRRLSILVLWGRIAVCNNEPQSFSLELV
jgi:hypothetical protein